MRKFLGLLVLAAAVLIPLAAAGSSSKWWEVWSGSAWKRLEPPYSTDGGRPRWLKGGDVECRGTLRRYAVRTVGKIGGQCVVQTKYSYYCTLRAGADPVIVRAPDMGPTEACESSPQQ